MVAPIFLFLLSLAGLAASVWVYGPVPSDALLLALICTIAAALLLLRALLRSRPQYIVVDGSNVMHWQSEQPSLQTVQKVLEVLTGHGLVPVVWFDANVGYKIGDRYLGPYPLSRMLGLPTRQVHVAPKGTPADPLLLDGARHLNASVVTNDRFRDWVESHPEIRESRFLVSGHMRQGEVVLDVSD